MKEDGFREIYQLIEQNKENTEFLFMIAYLYNLLFEILIIYLHDSYYYWITGTSHLSTSESDILLALLKLRDCTSEENINIVTKDTNYILAQRFDNNALETKKHICQVIKAIVNITPSKHLLPHNVEFISKIYK